MTSSGTHPQEGVRVALDLLGEVGAVARYAGFVYLPAAKVSAELAVDVATGGVVLSLGEVEVVDADAPEPSRTLTRADRSLLEQLGKQAHRLATHTPAEEGGGRWPRRIQRWRGPK